MGQRQDVASLLYYVVCKLAAHFCKESILNCFVTILSLRNLPQEITMPHFPVSQMQESLFPSVSEKGRAASSQAVMHSA